MKIFCIGYHKTGTTTLEAALHKLGYNVCGLRTDLVKPLMKNDFQRIFNVVKKFDAFRDNPWPLIYQEVDKAFQNSKFILTVRETDSWIKSVVNEFGREDTDMRQLIYGKSHPLGNEQIYIDRYINHNNKVIEYFIGREEDLLIVDWSKGDGWEKLCNFLSKPIPEANFPHLRKGEY